MSCHGDYRGGRLRRASAGPPQVQEKQAPRIAVGDVREYPGQTPFGARWHDAGMLSHEESRGL